MSEKVNARIENEAYKKDPRYVKHMPRADRRRQGNFKRDSNGNLFFENVTKVHPKMQVHILAMQDRDTNFRQNHSAGVNTRNTMPAFKRRANGRIAHIRNSFKKILKHEFAVAVKQFIQSSPELSKAFNKINKRTAKPTSVLVGKLKEPIRTKSGIQRFIAFAFNESMFSQVLHKVK